MIKRIAVCETCIVESDMPVNPVNGREELVPKGWYQIIEERALPMRETAAYRTIHHFCSLECLTKHYSIRLSREAQRAD